MLIFVDFNQIKPSGLGHTHLHLNLNADTDI